MEIQKQINKAIEMVSQGNGWYLIADTHIASSPQITLGYGVKSIASLMWKTCRFALGFP